MRNYKLAGSDCLQFTLVKMENLVSFLPGSLCLLIFLSVMIKFINKIWLTPIHIQSVMKSQGIKGPSYKLIHGNTKEIESMIKTAATYPMEMSHEIMQRVQPHLYSWMKLYGKNFLTWYGPRAQLVVAEPELIKEILADKDGAFPKTKPLEYGRKILGDGIITTMNMKKWSKLRKLSNHAFHAECLKGMVPAMVASVEMMLERWKLLEDKEIEVFQEFKVLTSEIISRTAFGSSYLEGQQVFDKLTKMGFIIARNIYKIRLPGIEKFMKNADDIESDKLAQGIENSIVSIIKKREAEATSVNSNGLGEDFLGMLLKAHHDSDEMKRLSVENMIDECKSFYVAGQETTASSLAWTSFLLAVHTDWQEKARKEVLEVIGRHDPSPDSISRLKIVGMIIHESLRLYPPVATLNRITKREVRLGKLILPANMEVIVGILAVQHDPEIWGQDAEVFKPERFADGVANATNNNSAAFMAFSLGPRMCVGSNFSITETKIALAMILQRYKFTLSPKYVHSPLTILTTRPQHGVQVILQPL